MIAIKKYMLLLFCFFAPTYLNAQKIVALVQIRNERETIEQFLRMIALYAESIVILDDASDDNTVEIIQRLATILPIEKIILNQVSAWQYGSEKDNREKLLLAGREVGGTHFIMLDADEMFSAHCLQNNWLKNKILSLKRGQTLRLPTIHQWNNLHLYRDDEQCNPTMYKWRRIYAFADDGVASYLSNQSAHGSISIHVSREPAGMICSEPTNSFYFNIVDYGVMHFKCVSLQNIDIKKAWYMCLEFIRLCETATTEKERSVHAQHINKIYNNYLYQGILSQTDSIICKQIPDSWYSGYNFFNGQAYTEPFVSKIEEIKRWFDCYGIDYFKELDIWSVEAVQKIIENLGEIKA